jgi:phosphoserine phosphatase RsbU/P
LNACSDFSTLLGDVNRLVYESSPEHFFASLFYAEYEPTSRSLSYVNAGHNPPMVLRRKNDTCTVFQLRAAGAPVGALQDTEYAPTTFQLEIGDVVVAYTDAITEAENERDELWGQARFEKLLRSCCHKSSSQIINRTFAVADVFWLFCSVFYC